MDYAELYFSRYRYIGVAYQQVVVFVDRAGEGIFQRYHAESGAAVKHGVKNPFEGIGLQALSLLTEGPYQRLLGKGPALTGKGYPIRVPPGGDAAACTGGCHINVGGT